MKCPRCGNENCSVINETTTTGKDFSAGKGCLGALLLGPLGVLCGACGKGKQRIRITGSAINAVTSGKCNE